MKVRNSTIPPDSLINQYLPANYSDSFECETDSDKKITPDDIQVSFWTTMPGWVNQLFKLRNLLVKPFGLQAGEEKIQEFKECIRSGGNCSFASVTDKSPQETIVCLDDKHLCAYLSIHIENLEGNRKKIRSITVVHFHYWLGYVYFYTICPFHYLIVRNMLRYTLKKLI